MRRLAAPLLLFALLASAGSARAAAPGALTQLAGTAGCVANALVACTPARGLEQVSGLALSPDGRFLYAVSSYNAEDHALTAFARDPVTGALAQLEGAGGCISAGGTPSCGKGRGLRGAIEVVVSPDGLNIYVAAPHDGLPGNTNGYLAAFRRDPVSGAVAQLDGRDGCVSAGGRDGCARGRAMTGLSGIAISPDGRTVYATAADADALVVFARDASTGALRQLAGRAGCVRNGGGRGCARGRGLASVTSVVVSPDGEHAYAAASLRSDAVTSFARNPATGRLRQLAGRAGCLSAGGAPGCRPGRGFQAAVKLAISADGTNVYAAAFGSSAVAVLRRDQTTGRLRQPAGAAGCVAQSAREGCTRTRGLAGATGVAVAPDGRNVYATGSDDDAVVALARAGAGGRLTALAGKERCAAAELTGCSRAQALDFAFDVVVAPDGRNVYVAGSDENAIAVFARAPAA